MQRDAWRAIALMAILATSTALAQDRHAGYDNATPSPIQRDQRTIAYETLRDITLGAIQEARRDATADQAATLRDRLDTYTNRVLLYATDADVDARPLVPPDVLADVRWAQRTAQPLPQLLSIYYGANAACQASQLGAPPQGFGDWYEAAQDVQLSIGSTAKRIRNEATTHAQLHLIQPLQQSAAALEAVLSDDLQQTQQCLSDVARTHGIIYPPTGSQDGSGNGIGFGPGATTNASLRILLSPTTTIATGIVNILGIANGHAEQPIVHIRSPTLALDATIQLSTTSFDHEFRVPATSQPGQHEIIATYANATATATLSIEPAPTRLRLQHPSRIEIQAPFTLNATLTTIAGLEDALAEAGVARFTGLIEGQFLIQNGRGSIDLFGTLRPRQYTTTVHYEGTTRLARTSQNMQLTIVERGSLDAPQSPDTLPGQAATIAEERFRFGLGGGITLTPTIPGTSWTIITIATSILGVFTALNAIGRRRERRLEPPPSTPGPIPDEPGQPPTSIVAGFGHLTKWLLSTRRIRTGHTARQIAKHLEPQRDQPTPEIQTFESIRYGNHPETPDDRLRVTTWLKKTWNRITQQENP